MEIYVPNKEIVPPARGFVVEKIDGKIVNEQSNAISGNFTATVLKPLLVGNATASHGISDLLTVGDVLLDDQTHAGKDGIVFDEGSSNSVRTMETTVETADFGVDGRRWKGVATMSADRSISQLNLGADMSITPGIDPPSTLIAAFSKGYAIVTKGTPLQVLQNQVYEVLWGFSFG